jgi:hypothetical protein
MRSVKEIAHDVLAAVEPLLRTAVAPQSGKG